MVYRLSVYRRRELPAKGTGLKPFRAGDVADRNRSAPSPVRGCQAGPHLILGAKSYRLQKAR